MNCKRFVECREVGRYEEYAEYSEVENLTSKGFNSALKSYFGYVAARILLPRNGFWSIFGFLSVVRNIYRRITGRHRNYVCCCLAFGDSFVLLLGLCMRQNKALQTLHSDFVPSINRSLLPFHAYDECKFIDNSLRGDVNTSCGTRAT